MTKEAVHTNPWFQIFRETSAGLDVYRLQAPDSAVMISRSERNELLFVYGSRHSFDTPYYELPGGAVGPNEQPEAAALRETVEETGYRTLDTKSLGYVLQAPAISSTRCHVFTGHLGMAGNPRLERGENWTVRLVKVDAVNELIASGGIVDAATLAALSLYFADPGRLGSNHVDNFGK